MTIRIARPEDGPDIAGIYAPIVESSFISFEEIAPTPDEMAGRIEATLKTHPWLVVEEAGRVIAYAYAGQHRTRGAYKWSCDVSVYVGEAGRRKGLARQLYARLFATLVNQGFVSAIAGITLPNEASVGLHEAMGFEPVGVYRRVGFKNGSWRDVGWWSCSLAAPPESPTDPLAFGAHRSAFDAG